MMMRNWLVLVALLLGMVSGVQAAATTDTLPNGLRVVVKPMTAAPIVSVTTLVDFSALDEPVAYAGIRQVLLTAMLNGSAASNAEALRAQLSAVGGSLQGMVHPDTLELTVTVPADALDVALDVLSQVLCTPKLDNDSVTYAIAQTQRMQRMESGRAVDAAARIARRMLYEDHPYWGDGMGDGITLQQINPDIVRLAHATFVVPNATVIALAGQTTAAQAKTKIAARFSGWTSEDRVERDPVAPPVLDTSTVELREAAVNSTCVMLTFPVCGAPHADTAPMRVLDAVLSGGTGARLFRSIREEQQLAYEVNTRFPAQASSSYYLVYALTNQQQMETMKGALVAELARLQTDRVTPEELTRAKAYLKGRYLLSHQYSAQTAFDLAWYTLLSLPQEDDAFAKQIDAVTAQDIQRVARTYFTKYHLVVIIPQAVSSTAPPLRSRSANVSMTAPASPSPANCTASLEQPCPFPPAPLFKLQPWRGTIGIPAA